VENHEFFKFFPSFKNCTTTKGYSYSIWPRRECRHHFRFSKVELAAREDIRIAIKLVGPVELCPTREHERLERIDEKSLPVGAFIYITYFAGVTENFQRLEQEVRGFLFSGAGQFRFLWETFRVPFTGNFRHFDAKNMNS
jgi:hypothetical protein